MQTLDFQKLLVSALNHQNPNSICWYKVRNECSLCSILPRRIVLWVVNLLVIAGCCLPLKTNVVLYQTGTYLGPGMPQCVGGHAYVFGGDKVKFTPISSKQPKNGKIYLICQRHFIMWCIPPIVNIFIYSVGKPPMTLAHSPVTYSGQIVENGCLCQKCQSRATLVPL